MNSRPARLLTHALACAALCAPAGLMAQEKAQPADYGLGDALWTKAKIDLRLRTYYFDSDFEPDSGSSTAKRSTAWAGGGWLAYDSAVWRHLFSVGATFFTSQPFWAPDDRDGTLLLKPGQDAINVLGIAYGRVHFGESTALTLYRQYVDLPNVNRQDNRMVPNTFEGFMLRGKYETFEYDAGWLEKIKTRNADTFRDFATVAGAENANEGMAIFGVTWNPVKATTFRISDHYVNNVFNTFFVEGAYTVPMSSGSTLGVAAHYMDQRTVGDDFIGDWNTWVAGAKAEFGIGALTLVGAYQQTGSGNKFQNPYGTYAGFQAMLLSDFDRADERAWMAKASYDFSGLGAEGVSASVSYNDGRHARDAFSDQRLSNDREIDVGLFWAPKNSPNAWLRPLTVTLWYANLDQSDYGITGDTDQYRAIVNYTIPLK